MGTRTIGCIMTLVGGIGFLALTGCKHEEPVKPVIAADSARPAASAPEVKVASMKPKEPATPDEQRPGCPSPLTVPSVSTEKSDVPSSAEWADACYVNTQEANSHAPRCSMSVKREWLKVVCEGDVNGYEHMEGFPRPGVDFFEFHKPGKTSSFVFRMKPGKGFTARFCRGDERANLAVNWPAGAPKPSFIAMSRGEACEAPSWTLTH